MKYVADVDGRSVSVTVGPDGLQVGEKGMAAALVRLSGGPACLLTVGTEVHEVLVRRGDSPGRYTLWVAGRRYDVEALDERTRTIREMAAKTAGPARAAPLVAPMPGLVVRILIEPGAAVAAGQGIIVMEAMKMENELRAQGAGVVKSVQVTAGTAVERGTVLVEFE